MIAVKPAPFWKMKFLPGLGVFGKLSAGIRGAREAFCQVLVANERRTRTKRQRKRQIATPLVGRSRALHSQRVFGGSVASQPTTRLLTVADGAFQPAGATSRMAGAQTQCLDLHFLSKSSAKVAAFAVRVCHGRCVEYHYVQKQNSKQITGHKFEAHLVGIKAESYCVGYVRGSPDTCKAAAEKFPDGSMWLLSKVILDTHAAAAFISTPVAFRVDLSKSSLVTMSNDGSATQPSTSVSLDLAVSLPSCVTDRRP